MLNAKGLFKNMAASRYVDTSNYQYHYFCLHSSTLSFRTISLSLYVVGRNSPQQDPQLWIKGPKLFNIVHLLYLLLIYFDSCQILGHRVAWRILSYSLISFLVKWVTNLIRSVIRLVLTLLRVFRDKRSNVIFGSVISFVWSAFRFFCRIFRNFRTPIIQT